MPFFKFLAGRPSGSAARSLRRSRYTRTELPSLRSSSLYRSCNLGDGWCGSVGGRPIIQTCSQLGLGVSCLPKRQALPLMSCLQLGRELDGRGSLITLTCSRSNLNNLVGRQDKLAQIRMQFQNRPAPYVRDDLGRWRTPFWPYPVLVHSLCEYGWTAVSALLAARVSIVLAAWTSCVFKVITCSSPTILCLFLSSV